MHTQETQYLALVETVDSSPTASAWLTLGDWLRQQHLLISACYCYQNALAVDPANTLVQERMQQWQPLADELQARFVIPRRSPCVSVVMLTYNQLDYTQLALESVLAKTPELLELIVIDNASADDTPAWLKQQALLDLRLKVHCNPTNRGFAQGCNQGLQLAQGDYLLVLNNDVLVTHGWLARLLLAIDTHGADLVGPVSTNVSGLQALIDIAPSMMAEEDILEEYAQQRALAMAGQGAWTHRLTGTCLLMKRSVLETIGGFDPRFGLGNFEDDDLSYRALLAGFKLWISRDACIHHFGSKSFDTLPTDVAALKQHNHHLFCQKWGLTHWPNTWLREPLAEITRQAWRPELFVPFV